MAGRFEEEEQGGIQVRQPRAMIALECFGCAKNAIGARKEGTLHAVLARSPRLRSPYFPVPSPSIARRTG